MKESLRLRLDQLCDRQEELTALLADVEVVATYKLKNMNRVRMENLFHRIFSNAQIDISIDDRFGNPVKPREWFLVPLQVIDEAVQRILDGSITEVHYDPHLARLVNNASAWRLAQRVRLKMGAFNTRHSVVNILKKTIDIKNIEYFLKNILTQYIINNTIHSLYR